MCVKIGAFMSMLIHVLSAPPECGRITRMKECNIVLQKQTADCRRRGLDQIPNSTFPADTRAIDLSCNDIRVLKNNSFSGFHQLVSLDLSYNMIEDLEPMAFYGLCGLKSLNLSRNRFPLIAKIFSVTLLKPLGKLSTLRINANKANQENRYGEGIDQGFSMLANLEELMFDPPLLFIFEIGFAKLTKLRTIITSGSAFDWNSCNLRILSNRTFKNLVRSNLTELRLSHCPIQSVEAGTFLPLLKLSILDLSYNNAINLSDALISLYGLRNRTMEEVNFSNLSPNSYSRTYGITTNVLEQRDLIYLNTLCVRYFDFSQNYFIFAFQSLVLFKNPSCLEVLKLCSHAMQSLPLYLLLEISRYKLLKYVDVSGNVCTKTDRGIIVSTTKSKISCSPNSICSSFNTSQYIDEITNVIPSSSFISLRTLKIAHVNTDTWLFKWPNCNSTIRELDISGTLSWRKITSNLSTLRIISLKRLTMRDVPGTYEYFKYNSIFTGLPDLEAIDLSDNRLDDLDSDIFGHSKPRYISLSNNKLVRVPSFVMSLKNVSQLDLSANVFSHLTADELYLIDSFIVAQYDKSHFQLNMSSNPLQCSCDTLDFIRWVYKNEAYLDSNGNYTCVLPNGTRIDLATFKAEIRSFAVNCISDAWIIISVVSLGFFVLFLGLFYPVYRNRVRLQYWLYTKLKPPVEMLIQQEYQYDAFVAYCEDNRRWVHDYLCNVLEHDEQSPLRLCIHDRDFRPGENILQNIADKIRESRKIIFVISSGFLESAYGLLELEFAGIKSMETGRDDVVLCINLEDIPVRNMPKILRNLWNRITFLTWPQDGYQQPHFWQQLRNAIADV